MMTAKKLFNLEGNERLEPVELVEGYLVRKMPDQGCGAHGIVGTPVGRALVWVVGKDAEGDEVEVLFRTGAPAARQVAKAIKLTEKIRWLRKVCGKFPFAGPIVRRIETVRTEIAYRPVPQTDWAEASRKVETKLKFKHGQAVCLPDMGL